MDKNKVKIELYKSKVMANFSHYSDGVLYYTVQLEEGKFQVPIEITEEYIEYSMPEYDGDDEVENDAIRLSSDLGTTSFYNEIKGSELSRWINVAIDNDKFFKVG